MIIESILRPIFFLISKLLSLFPDIPKVIYDISGISIFLDIVNTLLPNGYFSIFVSTVLFFKSFALIWAIIEWVYKKIPGVS